MTYLALEVSSKPNKGVMVIELRQKMKSKIMQIIWNCRGTHKVNKAVEYVMMALNQR